jgi:hypothetical protein
MLLHIRKRMIASRRVAGAGTCGARRLHAGKRVIAGQGCGIGSGDDFCARCPRRLNAGERVIAGKCCGVGAGGDFCARCPRRNCLGIAETGFCTRGRSASRGATVNADAMALRRNRGNRRARMRGDNANAPQLRRVCRRRNSGMAVIVVERQ